MIKIMDLNLWGYNNFNKRKSLIINFIKKNNPDIITFQEIRDDSRKNKVGNNQLKQLNSKLKYPYVAFFETQDVNKVNKRLNDPLYDSTNPRIREGMGVLSRYKITKKYGYGLKQHKRDAYTRGILYVRIKKDNFYDFIIVHYSANDLFSKLHFKETLDFIKKEKIEPIILGDFNIRKKQILYKLAPKDYKISSKLYKYFSYSSKKEILDYVLIPKKYSFKSFKSLNAKISDHNVIITEIDL